MLHGGLGSVGHEWYLQFSWIRHYSSINQIACFIKEKWLVLYLRLSISCALEIHFKFNPHPYRFCYVLKLYNSWISSLRYIKRWTVKISKTVCLTCIIAIIWFLNTLQKLQNSGFSSVLFGPCFIWPLLVCRSVAPSLNIWETVQ